jgi:hypothetical protein
MKGIKFRFLLIVMTIISSMANAQEDADSTGLPGDHFDLYGALEMFKQAKSIEAFEQAINSQDNKVNNIDLNEDGNVDYVRVIDNYDKNTHAFVLQVPVSDKENQDIAVIELEKTGDTTAILQIIGDEDIYGETTIIEAGDDEDNGNDDMDKKGGRGPSFNADDAPFTIVVNVWAWPSVRYVYAPVYRPWVSPWRWALYPTWYRPWHPLAWHVFHPFRARYHHVGFRTVTTHRVVSAHRVYAPHRVSSVTVKTRHSTKVNNYRVTKTTRTTKVKGPRGNSVKVKQSTTKVKKSRGRK